MQTVFRMSIKIPGGQRKRMTAIGVICELAKAKSQEGYLYGVQSKAISELDLSTGIDISECPDNVEEEKRLLSEIELCLIEQPQSFKIEKNKARQGVQILNEKLNRLKLMADNVQKYDIKTYRNTVLDVENTITELQNSNRFRIGKLKCDYLDIIGDIPESSELLREETKFNPKRSQLVTKSRKKRSSHEGEDLAHPEEYKDVEEFDRFLRSHGGHTGGWNDEQHSIYLSLRAKYRNNANRITEALKEISPGKK